MGFLGLVSSDLNRFAMAMRGAHSGTLRKCLDLCSPRFAPMLLCRMAYALHSVHLGPLAKVVSLINFVFFGIEIAVRCQIGPGLLFPHTQGTVIGAQSIGSNATIFQGVTLGARELDPGFDEGKRPKVGDDVLIGSGAKVLGGIMLGNRCKVGANAVVMESIPEDALAVGPALRVIAKS